MLKQQWQGLSQKDQRALMALGAVFFFASLYFFLWLPSEQKLQKAEQKLQQTEAQWQWLNAQLPNLKSQSQQPSLQLKNNSQLNNYLQKQLRKQNLYSAMEKMSSASKTTSVHFKEVKAPRLFRWLSQMEKEGLVAKTAKITAIKTGWVAAKITFEVQS